MKGFSFSFELISRWILAITLMFTLLGAIQILPQARAGGIEKLTLELIANAFMLGLVIGIGVALAQWFVLRNFSIGARDWLLATAIGYALGWSLGVPVNSIAMRFGSEYLGQGGPVAAIGYGVTIAGSVGISQYLVMRRKYFNAKWWFIVTFSGWILAWGLSMLPIRLLTVKSWYLVDPMMGVLFGLTFGAITALGLRYLVKFERGLAG